MAKSINTSIKTLPGDLQYITIKGEGRNGAMDGPPRMMYMASIVMDKDGEAHKALKASINQVWNDYCKENGVKGAPKSTGIKPVMVETDELDEYGAKVKVESDKVIATFKTDVAWPDGKSKIVRVFQPSGKDITDVVAAADWSIGNGTKGIIHGLASANDGGKTHKVSLYLTAVQIHSNLVKYTGSVIEVDAYEGVDDIPLDEDLGNVGGVEV